MYLFFGEMVENFDESEFEALVQWRILILGTNFNKDTSGYCCPGDITARRGFSRYKNAGERWRHPALISDTFKINSCPFS